NNLGRRMKPLHVAFVWHMHQPYYKDDLTNTYLLPWVRLRCAKDYYKMPALMDGYPKVRATFNLVPSLLAQIEDYGREGSVDLFLNLSSRHAAELTAEERGQPDLTFSPYYHPILPLLCHVDSARTATPNIRLPERHFSHRENAERQIELGQGLFERMIGHRPAGMWPSEMAVGEAVVGLAADAGVQWMISDEEVLARSIDVRMSRDGEGRVSAPSQLYRPFRMERE